MSLDPPSERAFGIILGALVGRLRSARGAALVDLEGETVDHAGWQDPYLTRLAAAHLRIALEETRGQTALTTTTLVIARATRATFVIRSLPEGYGLVLWLARGAWFATSQARPLEECARRLCEEAGWPWSGDTAWYSVDVQTVAGGRPEALRTGDRLEHFEILGRYASGLTRGERGWRVRLQAGIETTLVREPGGFWYTDQPFDREAARRVPLPQVRKTR